MKKIEVQNAVNALGRVPVNKIKDDSIRNILIYDYRKLRKASREIEEERSDMVEKLQTDFVVEVEEVRALRAAGKPVTGQSCVEFLKAEAELNRTIRAMFREEIELELKTVNMDDFVKAVRDGDYTLEDLSALDGVVLY